MTKVSVNAAIRHSDVRAVVEGYASANGVSLFGNMKTAINAEEGTEYFWHPSFEGTQNSLNDFRGLYRDTDDPDNVVGVYLVDAFDTALSFGWTLSSDYHPPNEAYGGTTYNWNHAGTPKLSMVYEWQIILAGVIQSTSTSVGLDSGQNKGFTTVSNLNSTTQYTFRVRAKDLANNYTPWSAEVSGTTIAPPATNNPPTAPSSISVSGVGTNKTVQWHKSTDLETVDNSLTYYIQLRLNNSSGTEVPQSLEIAPGYFQHAHVNIGSEYGDSIGTGNTLGGGTFLSFDFQNLNSGQLYWFKLIARDDGTNLKAAPEYSAWSSAYAFTA